MRVTRIAYSKGLNRKKYEELQEQANRLGVVRSDIWQRYGSIAGVGKNITRRLSAWTKGVIAQALNDVSRRRGSTLVLINAAYTSQMDSRNGALLGRRKEDSFYCFDGEVLQADENAARNIQARLFDSEIDQWTPYKKVKSILLERTERLRLGLLNQDSSCSDSSLSTESELPNGQLCPTF